MEENLYEDNETNNNPFRIFNSGYMQCSDHGCIDGSHGTDLHSDADGSADDDADICRDFGGCDLRLKTRRGFHGRMGGGVQYLIGPTGGFLLSFPIMAYLIGLGVEKKKQKGMFSLFLVLGTVANYAVGVAMYCVLMDASVWTGITACVLPFIPTAVIKAVAAAILGLQVRSRLAAVLQTA